MIFYFFYEQCIIQIVILCPLAFYLIVAISITGYPLLHFESNLLISFTQHRGFAFYLFLRDLRPIS